MFRPTLLGLLAFASLACSPRPERSALEDTSPIQEVLPTEGELPSEVRSGSEEPFTTSDLPLAEETSEAPHAELPPKEEVPLAEETSPEPIALPTSEKGSVDEALPIEEESLPDSARRFVAVPAVLRLAAFAAGDPAHHHFLTWSDGRAGSKALLETSMPDEDVLDALIELGAKPGNNLREEAWTKRSDRAHPAPDERASGSRLAIELVLPDGRRVAVDDFLVDLDENGLEWVLAGNRDLIDVWRSGCVMCLQSCPGSKIANRAATMRDLHDGRARYVPSDLAKDLGEGARIVVEIAVVEEER